MPVVNLLQVLITLFRMVHKCVVPGCPSRSDQKENTHVKFHRLPHRNKKLLQLWLDLMGRTLTEINVHSRICSLHFSKNGFKKFGSRLPEIFPWRQSTNVSAPSETPPPETVSVCAACIVHHDHNYSQQRHTHSPQPLPTILTCNVGSTVSLSPSTSAQPLIAQNSIGIQTDTSNKYFCIEDFANDDTAITFYTGFESYEVLLKCFQFLGDAVNHLKYWGNKPSTLSSENRGSSRTHTYQ